MGSIRKIMAAMLIGLAFAAFQSDADAQTRRSSSDSQRSSTSRQTVNRSSNNGSSSKRSEAVKPSSQTKPSSTRPSTKTRPSSTQTKPSSTRPSGQTRPSVDKPSGRTTARPSSGTRPSAVRPSGQTKPSGQTRPSGQTKPTAAKPSAGKPDFKPGDQNRPAQVTRPGRHVGSAANGPSMRPDHGPGGKHDHRPSKPVHIRPDHRHDKPRIHPRDRDFMRWNRPSYFWTGYNHYYGHRVRVLPARVIKHIFFGHTYYCYNDIWYRPYGGYYVVCRPPYGTALAAGLIADMTWTAVRLSYYTTVLNTYSQINENNRYIAEQNEMIARNNATIAAQNSAIAQGQQLAQLSYNLADQLGLVQSYAAAGTEYFYQDGVFYAKDASGQYKVIVPPAGALVETLPEDYDMVTLSDGNEYYKVDETIYRITISEGKPYFEVLGQLYS